MHGRVTLSLPCRPPRNEVDATDATDHSAKAPMGLVVFLISALHVMCCGLLLPLLTGLSAAAIFSSWPAIGAMLALLSGVGLVRHLRRSRDRCSDTSPQAPKPRPKYRR